MTASLASFAPSLCLTSGRSAFSLSSCVHAGLSRRRAGSYFPPLPPSNFLEARQVDPVVCMDAEEPARCKPPEGPMAARIPQSSIGPGGPRYSSSPLPKSRHCSGRGHARELRNVEEHSAFTTHPVLSSMSCSPWAMSCALAGFWSGNKTVSAGRRTPFRGGPQDPSPRAPRSPSRKCCARTIGTDGGEQDDGTETGDRQGSTPFHTPISGSRQPDSGPEENDA